MALNFSIHTDLELDDLHGRMEDAATDASGIWETWSASIEDGPFHEEVMSEYGVTKGFKTLVYTRHNKDHSVEARAKLLAFFQSLPGRKLMRQDDILIAFEE